METLESKGVFYTPTRESYLLKINNEEIFSNAKVLEKNYEDVFQLVDAHGVIATTDHFSYNFFTPLLIEQMLHMGLLESLETSA